MKPLAFRVHDFKSIVDSGVCILSADRITVLAGQNEAGKTAVLSALRDFDLPAGSPPLTKDYRPDDRFDTKPQVSVQFELDDIDEIVAGLQDEDLAIPEGALKQLRTAKKMWVMRDLISGNYSLQGEIDQFWNHEPPGDSVESEAGSEKDSDSSMTPPKTLAAAAFAAWLRDYWPAFVYFDSFQDTLPRQVDFSDLKPSKKPNPPAPSSAITAASTAAVAPARPTPAKAPASVMDFVVMADLDLGLVESLAEQDKALGNYLSTRSAAITGDFLTYWKQKVDQSETVDLRVRHARDSEGTLKLLFYVHDKSDQYPDQRSKGFLWFLSFYLRLAAAQKKSPGRQSLLLIDEPGSYLHARAQRDVLHLFEDRIAANDLIVYSTHSPYLLPAHTLHRLRIVLKTTLGGTRVLDRLTHPELRGANFADSLSPVITAIGIDISQSITFNKPNNLFVEGISDYLYITSWAAALRPEFLAAFNIFPGTGATTIPLLGSLFTGWGFRFVVLLDNDEQGKATKNKLMRELSVEPSRLIQPKDAKAIEDVFSHEDFRALLAEMDKSLTLNSGETASAAISRQSVDKVLLARTYSERASTGKWILTKKTQDAIGRLLTEIWDAWPRGIV